MAAYCRRKLNLALDNQGLPMVNILAPLVETIARERSQLSEAAMALAVDEDLGVHER